MPSWLITFLGIHNEAGSYYAFWSGFGGSVPDILIITGAIGWYWHRTCHVGWCWRVGRHPAANGIFRLCRRHHPDLHGQKPGAELIERLHLEWKRAR